MLSARSVMRNLALRFPPVRNLVENRAALYYANQAQEQIIFDFQAERDALQVERDALQAEKMALLQSNTELKAERERHLEALAGSPDERLAIRNLIAALEAERDLLSGELVRIRQSREAVLVEKFYDELSSRSALIEKTTSDMFVFLRHRLAPQMSALIAGQASEAARILRAVEMGNVGSLSQGLSGIGKYIDLLELTLTGAIYGDAPMQPGSPGKYDPAVRAIGRDWPSQAHTMIGSARLRNLRELCERVINEDIPGDFIETGVWRGGACILMRGILSAYGDSKRRVFVADSFRGLPEPNPNEYQADAGDIHHTFEKLNVSRQEVEENFRRYGLLDEQVHFLEGWFKDTLSNAPIEQLSLLRLDGDMYESTIQALDALYFKISPGGFVIVDDYILEPCAMAIHDFRDKHGIVAQMHNVDDAAVWWQVER